MWTIDINQFLVRKQQLNAYEANAWIYATILKSWNLIDVSAYFLLYSVVFVSCTSLFCKFACVDRFEYHVSEIKGGWVS